MVMPSLPPGFRFHPTDVELVVYYLKRKVLRKSFHLEAISEVELYKFAPWDLPEKSLLRSRDREWYFFCPRDRKYPNATRANRATDIGYWKSTGNDKPVIHNSRTIGFRKTLVFHLGKAPKGDRTDWVMHEYRLVDTQLFDAGYSQNSYVLCKIFEKSGLGPKIGEQHGAPFNEEEWEDEIAEDVVSLPCLSCPSLTLLDGSVFSSNAMKEPPATSGGVDVPSSSDLLDDGLWLEELAELLHASPVDDNGMKKMPDSEVLCKTLTGASTSEPLGIYDGLEDLSSMIFSNTSYSEGMANEYDLIPILSDLSNEQFLELNDFCDLGENCLFKLNGSFDQ